MKKNSTNPQKQQSNVILFPVPHDPSDPDPYIDKQGRIDLSAWLGEGLPVKFLYDPGTRTAALADENGNIVWTIRRAA